MATRDPASLPFTVPDNFAAWQVDIIKIKLQFSDGHLHSEFYLRAGVIPHWFLSLLLNGDQKYYYELIEYEGKLETISKIMSKAKINKLEDIIGKYGIIKEKTYILN